MNYPIFYINVSKLASEIRSNNFTPAKRRVISVGKAEIAYAINMDSAAEVTFCYFDFVVSDALYSLYSCKRNADRSKEVIVTLGEILRIMSGKPNQTLTPVKKERLRESIEKLMTTDIFIDCKKELEQRKAQDCEFCFEGVLAPLEVVKRDPEGKPLSYRFVGKMPLYEYTSNVNHQIARFPVELMKTPLSDSIDAIMIKHYLIKRIEHLRNQKNKYNQPKISYTWSGKADRYGHKGMLNEIGITRSTNRFATMDEWQQKVTSIDRIVRSILDSFLEQHYIYGYNTYKNDVNRLPAGVTIIPRADPDTAGKGKKKAAKSKPNYAADPFELLKQTDDSNHS